jgi:hypothetical protein
MAIKKVSVKKADNKKPHKVGKSAGSVKAHNMGKTTKAKKVKAVNMPSNYGVK